MSNAKVEVYVDNLIEVRDRLKSLVDDLDKAQNPYEVIIQCSAALGVLNYEISKAEVKS